MQCILQGQSIFQVILRFYDKGFSHTEARKLREITTEETRSPTTLHVQGYTGFARESGARHGVSIATMSTFEGT